MDASKRTSLIAFSARSRWCGSSISNFSPQARAMVGIPRGELSICEHVLSRRLLSLATRLTLENFLRGGSGEGDLERRY